ncbi:MAG: deoxyribonuclease IV [Firmicutes bacterium]|nr:deoxyribonuclease IV [Bacillota bacterium]
MKFGVHVSRAGGLHNALRNAVELDCSTIQMFAGNPRSLRSNPIQENEAFDFKEGLTKHNIEPLVIHAPYLLNLASPKEEIYELSIQALAREITGCITLNADYLVIHPGNHLGSGIDAGIARIAQAIENAAYIAGLKHSNEPLILLETVSGAGTEIGWAFQHQRDIMAATDRVSLGVCLDTCHMFAAGYDIVTEEGLAGTLEELDRLLGVSCVKIIHANDSVGVLGSRIDRHADIGFGEIGEKGFRVIFGDSRLRSIPFILETPKKTIEDDRRNLAVIKRLAEEAVVK